MILFYVMLMLDIMHCKESTDSKRLLLSDPEVMLKELNNLKSRLAALEASNTEITNLKSKITSLESSNKVLQDTVGKLQNSGGGVTYTRWGKRQCDGNGTQLVYTGFGAGSYYNDGGTASNYLCMPTDPTWGQYNDARDPYRGHVWGMEYEWIEFDNKLHDKDAPCAVCRSESASNILMIPGRNVCYDGWKSEYHGYLVSGSYNEPAATQYICLDATPDVLYGSQTNDDGAVLHSVEGICGSLPCPPYVDGRELTCVVCSK